MDRPGRPAPGAEGRGPRAPGAGKARPRAPLEARALLGEALARQPFARALGGPLAEALGPLAEARPLKAGDPVFLQGDPADWVFLLCRGKVRVFLTDPSGRERTLRIILPGEPFGEAAAFLDSGYPASSAALEPSLALRFGTSSLAGLVRENPNLALAAIGVLASRLKEMTALLGSGLKEVEPRLAAFLLELPSEAGRVWLPAKKAELARHLGTTPESLSRALGRLKAQGLVREDERYHISILDRDRLEGIALG